MSGGRICQVEALCFGRWLGADVMFVRLKRSAAVGRKADSSASPRNDKLKIVAGSTGLLDS